MVSWKTLCCHPYDDASDRLSHLLTSILLLGAALITYHRSNSKLLHCRPPTNVDYSPSFMPPLHYVETACASHSLIGEKDFQQVQKKDASLNGQNSSYILDWPPYVPYVLTVAALFAFFLPAYIRFLLCPPIIDDDFIDQSIYSDRNQICFLVANRILKRKIANLSTFQYAASKLEKFRRFSIYPIFIHFVMKATSISILCSILQLIKTIFPFADHKSNFYEFGWSLIKAMLSEKNSVDQNIDFAFHRFYPTDFVCPITTIFNRKSYALDYHCVFASNALYGCLCLLLWIWINLMIVSQSISVWRWIWILFSSGWKKRMIDCALEKFDDHRPTTPKRASISLNPILADSAISKKSIADHRFLNTVMTADTILILYRLRQIFGQFAVDETIRMLRLGYVKEAEKSSGDRRGHIEVVV